MSDLTPLATVKINVRQYAVKLNGRTVRTTLKQSKGKVVTIAKQGPAGVINQRLVTELPIPAEPNCFYFVLKSAPWGVYCEQWVTDGAGVAVPLFNPQITEDFIMASAMNLGITTRKTVAPTAHGFAVKDAIRPSGSSFAKAQADSAANAEVAGIVVEVINANSFVYQTNGPFVTSGLTDDAVYFLDPAVAGGITTVEPSTTGQVRKVLGQANSTTEFNINIQQGFVI